MLPRCFIETHSQHYISSPSIALLTGVLSGAIMNDDTDGALLDIVQRQSRPLIGSLEVPTFLTSIGIKLCLQHVKGSRAAVDSHQVEVCAEEQTLHAIIRGYDDELPTGRTITVMKTLAMHIRTFLPMFPTWTRLTFDPASPVRQAYEFLCICITACNIHIDLGSPSIQRYNELRCSGLAHEAALQYVYSVP
ncbi:hypothetical protein BDV38DRAFT_210839 [Aspergillus pseudotamarii]|uniref:Uncharacterized protein n=1 Tax=Aspergillus pseudotamarii TaxID=132259 RepID=A0A5N6SGB9_ASPPS|nr:uncharacterized protein BDV38DRAFT_210839 [Aspergillus pseudotamarii]KAE8132433.1 hypothetical protein BDV38DRAFT_210839 [Aspergillus pseudotamarii]